MGRFAAYALGVLAAGAMTVSAMAANVEDMVGKWKWQDFTVEVVKGGNYGISAKVVEGPKNIGMEMIQSPLKKEGDYYVGRVKHPVNGMIYNTKISMQDKNSWKLDGCTDDGACASGVFVRVQEEK